MKTGYGPEPNEHSLRQTETTAANLSPQMLGREELAQRREVKQVQLGIQRRDDCAKCDAHGHAEVELRMSLLETSQPRGNREGFFSVVYA